MTVGHPLSSSTFTLRAVQEKLGLSRTVLVGLVRAGFVTPSRGPRNEHRFTFQDLMLLRTADTLRRSRIAPRTILRSLAKLKASLPTELPLTGLRITAVGAEVAVRARDGTLAAASSGQLLMDFEVAPVEGSVTFLDRPTTAPPHRETPADRTDATAFFRRGEALEAADDPAAAEAAYREALAGEPAFAAAYLNLGALLCESERCGAAVALYDEALRHCPGSALIRFNRAVALEDLGRFTDAVDAYEQSLALDPGLADAHYNLGRLQQQRGDARAALKHFSAYRRLQPA